MRKERDLLIVGNLAKDIVFGEIKYGGSAASIAINAARMGLKTGIMSVLGKDEFSQKYRIFLTDNGIDTRLVFENLDTIPVCEVVSRRNLISSSNWLDNGCHPAMEKMSLDKKIIDEYSFIHLVSCPPNLSRKISNIPSIRLSYEPGPMLKVSGEYFDSGVRDKSDLIFLNEEEYEVVLRVMNTSNPKDLVRDGDKTMIVTKGKNGSDVYRIKEGNLKVDHIDSILVNRVIDCTGAGDSYKSGFFASFLRRGNLLEACKIGSLAGSCAVKHKGGVLSENDMKKIRRVI